MAKQKTKKSQEPAFGTLAIPREAWSDLRKHCKANGLMLRETTGRIIREWLTKQ